MFPTFPGAGPRHFAFHPNGDMVLSAERKESSTLAFMRYNPVMGALRLVDEVSTLPEGFVGTNFTLEMMVLCRTGRSSTPKSLPRDYRQFPAFEWEEV